jgi:RNA polymerase sigma-70 factor (ECF subfamily)
MVRNASVNHIRRLKVEKRYDNRQRDEHAADMEYYILREETYRLLFRAVDELPPRNREVFRLYMQGYDGQQIATMLDITVDTVYTHRKHALRILREKLGHIFVMLFRGCFEI